MGVGVQHHSPAALPREKPGTHCTGGWIDSRAILIGKENLVLTGVRTPNSPARMSRYSISM